MMQAAEVDRGSLETDASRNTILARRHFPSAHNLHVVSNRFPSRQDNLLDINSA